MKATEMSIHQLKQVYSAEDIKGMIVEELSKKLYCDKDFLQSLKDFPISFMRLRYEFAYDVTVHNLKYTYTWYSTETFEYKHDEGYTVDTDLYGKVSLTPKYEYRKGTYEAAHFSEGVFNGQIKSVNGGGQHSQEYELEEVSLENRQKAERIAEIDYDLPTYVKESKKNSKIKYHSFYENNCEVIFCGLFIPFWEFEIGGIYYKINACTGNKGETILYKKNKEYQDVMESYDEKYNNFSKELQKIANKQEKVWAFFSVLILIYCILVTFNAATNIIVDTIFLRWLYVPLGVAVIAGEIGLLWWKHDDGAINNRKEYCFSDCKRLFKSRLEKKYVSIEDARNAAEKAYATARKKRNTCAVWIWFAMPGIVVVYLFLGMLFGHGDDFGIAARFFLKSLIFDTPVWHAIFG